MRALIEPRNGPMPKSEWMKFAAAALLGALFAWLLLKRAPSSEVQASAPASTETRFSPQSAMPSAPDVRVELPPQGTPLRDSLRQLRKAAISGSPSAACRLVRDIKRCSDRADILSVAENLTKFPSPPGAGAQLPEALLRQTDENNAFCEGVSRADMDSAYLFQTIAANSGDQDFVRWLVYSPAISAEDFLENLDRWQDYRARAEQYVRKALLARNGEDFQLLVLIYTPKDVQIARPAFRVDDYRTFLALVAIAKANGVAMPAQALEKADAMRSTMSAEERLAADKRTSEIGVGWAFSEAQKSPVYRQFHDSGSALDCAM